MKENEKAVITLNGIRFSESMMETLQEWYSTPMPEEYTPHTMISCLENVQRHLIELSEVHDGKDEKTMSALRQLLYVIDNVKPFTEGGAVCQANC